MSNLSTDRETYHVNGVNSADTSCRRHMSTPSEAGELSPLLEVISFIVGILNPYGKRIERVETIITYLSCIEIRL